MICRVFAPVAAASSRRLRLAAVVGICLASGVTVLARSAQAAVTTVSGQAEILALTDVRPGANESSLKVRVFDERQATKLASPLRVNVSSTGTYTTKTSPKDIPAGTVVSSHLLHADPVGKKHAIWRGSAQFDTEILGLIVLTADLNNSDLALGRVGTTYPTGSSQTNARGLEGNTDTDSVTISADRKTLKFVLDVAPAIDQVRVITAGDAVPPETTLTSTPPAVTSSRSATFAFASSESGSTFACSLDGSAFAACTPPHSIANLADGEHTFRVRAIDAAGNVDATPAAHTWTVDATAPETTIDAGPSATEPVSVATLDFSSPDPTATFACSVDGAPYAACVSPHELSGLSDGEHVFRVRASDPVGNVDATPAEVAWTIATMEVNSTNDANDGVCGPSHCSLREAINAANASADLSGITFRLADTDRTIRPASALPSITAPVVIDGTTQPGFDHQNPKPIVEIDATQVRTVVLGLVASDSTVRGLVLNGLTPTTGGAVLGVSGDRNRIVGNFVGLDASGAVAKPGPPSDPSQYVHGVDVEGVGNILGGDGDEDRNVISGHTVGVVDRSGLTAQGNFIGTDASGALPIGNGTGLSTHADVADADIRNNVIASSAYNAVTLHRGSAVLRGNRIGTDMTGTRSLGNGFAADSPEAAIAVRVLTGMTRVVVGGTGAREGNVIAHNASVGISAYQRSGGTQQLVLGNAIYDNGGIGIDLHPDGETGGVVTLNDSGDGDSGLQNFPVLTSVAPQGSDATTITGTLNSKPNGRYRIELFVSRECDPSGYGEGETFLAAKEALTDATGDVGFSVTVSALPSGGSVTATATDLTTNETSEFSACRPTP